MQGHARTHNTLPPALSSAAEGHDSPPEAPLRDGGRVQLVQRYRQLCSELHLLYLDLLPAGRRWQGCGFPGKAKLSVHPGQAGIKF